MGEPGQTTDVQTRVGVGRLHRYPAHVHPRAVLALGHGAGGGVHARDLQALALALPRSGIEVILVEQPWAVAGKKIAPAPSQLDAAWLPLIEAIDRGGLPLVAGGRSAGARVACRTASEVGAVGVLALAFPLHPPGRPESSRIEELTSTACPALVIQGTRDTFGTAAELTRAVSRDRSIKVRAIADADHGFKVAAAAATTTADALKAVVKAVNRESDRLIGC
jgi:predicted alpha/beta-hydrolase family hydrolase